MNLTPDGKKRLDDMKKTLTAGLPLASLLAAATMVSTVVQGCGTCVPGISIPPRSPEPEEWVLDGDIAIEEPPPEEPSRTMGVPVAPEVPSVPEIPAIPSISSDSPPQP